MTVDQGINAGFQATNDRLTEQLARIVALENASSGSALNSLIPLSGRFYMETTIGTRWVTDSDDNYGFNYHQLLEPSGDNQLNPIREWEHMGLVIPKGRSVKGLTMRGRANNVSVGDIEMVFMKTVSNPVSRETTGVDSDAEVTNTEIWRGLWLSSTDGNGPMTGAINDRHTRYWTFDESFPDGGELSVYLRPTLPQTIRRYFNAAWTWEIG